MGTINVCTEHEVVLERANYFCQSAAESELKGRFLSKNLDSRKWAAERLSFIFENDITCKNLLRKNPINIIRDIKKYRQDEFTTITGSLQTIMDYLAKNCNFNPFLDLVIVHIESNTRTTEIIHIQGDANKATPMLFPLMPMERSNFEECDDYEEEFEDGFDISEYLDSCPLPQESFIKNPLIKEDEKTYIYDLITTGPSTQESLKHKYEQLNKYIDCTIKHSNVMDDMSEEEIYEYFVTNLKKNNIPENIINMLIAEVLHYKRDGVFSPIIFYGPRGIGKTEAATRIAKLFNLPFNKIEAPSAASSCGMKGTDSHYASSDVGALADTMIRNHCVNPVILIDEIDKAPKPANSSCNLQDELLSICDKSRSIKDLFLNLTIDSSRCIFFFTANDLSKVSPYLLDRCKVIEYPNINFEKVNTIAMNHLKEEFEKQHYDQRVELDMEIIESGIKQLWKNGIKSFRPYMQFVSSTLKYAYIDSLANKRKQRINEHHTSLAMGEFKSLESRPHFGFGIG